MLDAGVDRFDSPELPVATDSADKAGNDAIIRRAVAQLAVGIAPPCRERAVRSDRQRVVLTCSDGRRAKEPLPTEAPGSDRGDPVDCCAVAQLPVEVVAR
jgi:hypothetical protein